PGYVHLELVDGHRHDDDDPFDDHLPEVGNSDHHQPVGENADDKRADDRPAYRAAPSHEGSAAQDSGGNRIQLVGLPGGGMRRHQLGGHDQAAEGREPPGDDVHVEADSAHPHPG